MEQDIQVDFLFPEGNPQQPQIDPEHQSESQPGPSESQPDPSEPPTPLRPVVINGINYSSCNAMEKRIFMRRPLNAFAVMSLKKPKLRKYLQANNVRFKKSDKKDRLVQLVKSVVNRHDGERTKRLADLRAARANGLRRPPAPAPVMPPQRLFPVGNSSKQLCASPLCNCKVSIETVLADRRVPLPLASQEMLRSMVTKSKQQVDEVLRGYGVNPSGIKCRQVAIIRLRDLLEVQEEAHAEVLAMRPHPRQCLVCRDAPITGLLEPCGHAVCCVPCSRGLATCPDCAADVVLAERVFIMFD